MYNHNALQVPQALAQSGRQSRDNGFPVTLGALSLYERARRRGWLRRVRCWLCGEAQGLLELEAITASQVVGDRRYAGVRTVPLERIRGSSGRCQDFDAHFWPLRLHNRARWLSIATACELGTSLAPVDLIQVGEQFFVQDGHHRISVAHVLGQTAIEAQVTVWEVAGPLPWKQEVPIGWPARLLSWLARLLVTTGGRLVRAGLPAHQPFVRERRG